MTETIPAPAADLLNDFALQVTLMPATEPAMAETLGLAHATNLLSGLKRSNLNLVPAFKVG